MKKEDTKNEQRPELHGMVLEPTYSGVTTFFRRTSSRDLKGVDLAVTGIPLDTATTKRLFCFRWYKQGRNSLAHMVRKKKLEPHL